VFQYEVPAAVFRSSNTGNLVAVGSYTRMEPLSMARGRLDALAAE
jgi:hypothetical protein